jgi:hypothetical protein
VATLDEIEHRLAGIESQMTVMSKEVKNLATAWREYLALTERGTQFFTGLMQNSSFAQTMKEVTLPHLPPVDESVIEDPMSALCGGGGLPPAGALSPEEVAEILRKNSGV